MSSLIHNDTIAIKNQNRINPNRITAINQAQTIEYYLKNNKKRIDYRKDNWVRSCNFDSIENHLKKTNFPIMENKEEILTDFRIEANKKENKSFLSVKSKFSCSCEHIVKYDGNGATSGTVPIDPHSPYLEESDVVVMKNTGNLKNPGFQFLAWSENTKGIGLIYQEGDHFSMPNHSLTLYAIWNAVSPTYFIVYHAEDADSGFVPIDPNNPYTEGAAVPILGNPGNLQKAGFQLIGWTIESNDNDSIYKEGSSIIMPNDSIHLHAKWKAAPSINFKNTYGENNTENKSNIPSLFYSLDNVFL